MAASPISDELGALQQARSRLEAALADDENWRALTQRGGDDASAEARAARQARNARLEMALADNAHYQAWKHVNGAIDALRTRSLAQPQAAEALVRPASTGEATRDVDDLPDDIATLLRDATPQSVQQVDEPVAPAAGAQSPSARAGLVERLEQLEDGQAAATAGSAVRPGVEASAAAQGQARKPERKTQSAPADPPEATVTFVVREVRAPLPPSAELQSDLGTEPNSASARSPAQPRGRAGAAGRNLFPVQGQRRGSRSHHRLGGKPQTAPRGRGAGRHRAPLPQGPVGRLGRSALDATGVRRAVCKAGGLGDRTTAGRIACQPPMAE